MEEASSRVTDNPKIECDKSTANADTDAPAPGESFESPSLTPAYDKSDSCEDPTPAYNKSESCEEPTPACRQTGGERSCEKLDTPNITQDGEELDTLENHKRW